jgi:hypothetical protein
MHFHQKCKIKITRSKSLYYETNLVFGENSIALIEKKCKVTKILALLKLKILKMPNISQE